MQLPQPPQAEEAPALAERALPGKAGNKEKQEKKENFLERKKGKREREGCSPSACRSTQSHQADNPCGTPTHFGAEVQHPEEPIGHPH